MNLTLGQSILKEQKNVKHAGSEQIAVIAESLLLGPVKSILTIQCLLNGPLKMSDHLHLPV